MIDFIIMLEDMLSAKDIDWETQYLPDMEAYVLKYNDIKIGMFEIKDSKRVAEEQM